MKRMPIKMCGAVLSSLLLASCGGGGGTDGNKQALAANPQALADQALSSTERLGKRLFNDANLSEPRGTACVSWHQGIWGDQRAGLVADDRAQYSV